MRDSCQFLRLTSNHEPVCMIAVNFYSVGKAREICRACPLADLGDASVCENLDVFVYQDWRPEGCTIQVEANCHFEDDTLPGNRCPNCPQLERLVITTSTEAMRLVRPELQKEIL